MHLSSPGSQSRSAERRKHLRPLTSTDDPAKDANAKRGGRTKGLRRTPVCEPRSRPGSDRFESPLWDRMPIRFVSSQRFHALLNSLFKVLFNFPSGYLFAIGLVVVFSLRWSLPPVLGLHYRATRLKRDLREAGTLTTRTGLTPSLASEHTFNSELKRPRPNLWSSPIRGTPVRARQSPERPSLQATRWAPPFSVAPTKGILVSFFSSAY